MKRAYLSNAAEEDLGELWEWVAADNRQAADKLVRDIVACCDRIARHPFSGSRRTDFTKKPLRFMLVRQIIFVAYDPASSPVEIVRILHTARNIQAVLDDEES